jgi:hypothetical protein
MSQIYQELKVHDKVQYGTVHSSTMQYGSYTILYW